MKTLQSKYCFLELDIIWLYLEKWYKILSDIHSS